MARLVRITMLALLLAGILGGAFGGTRHAAAANGYEQWVLSDDGRCLLFWDGYNYTLAGCLRADGGVNGYYWSGAQWVYLFSSGALSDGGTWLYYQGIYYYDMVGIGYVDGIYPTSYVSGGTVYEGIGDDPVANSFFMSMRTGSSGVWTAPSCIYVVGGICYY